MFNDLWLGRKLKKKNKDALRERQFLNLESIQSILVLFDTSDYEEVDVFIEKLERMGKKITVYAYKRNSDRYDYSETPYHIITPKYSSVLFGHRLTAIAEELKKNSFDLAIDLTVKRNISLEYLLAHADVLAKVGLKKNNQSPYDLSIIFPSETPNESMKVKELSEQIFYYLYTIRSK